jgi:hypothetical protein
MHSAVQTPLPEEILDHLFTQADQLSQRISNDLATLESSQVDIRTRLLSDGQIIEIDTSAKTFPVVIAVDGASATEDDRAMSYILTSALAICEHENIPLRISSAAGASTHSLSTSSIAAGVMMMQEVMLAVQSSESNPACMVMTDGSRMSHLIRINQLYHELSSSGELELWRNPESVNPMAEVLREYESRNWMLDYFNNDHIFGHLKMGTTAHWLEKAMPESKLSFDDKAFAAMVLTAGEALAPMPAFSEHTIKKLHMDNDYPFRAEMKELGRKALFDNPYQHHYYRTHHGTIAKIEAATSVSREQLDSLFSWWDYSTISIANPEPYVSYLVDKMAKSAVSNATKVIRDMTRVRAESAWAWMSSMDNRS